MGVDREWERLQALYAELSDAELVELAGSKAGLTEVAQQVIEAEVRSRGLVVEAAAPVAPDAADGELPESENDPSLVELTTFSMALEAEKALAELELQEIPVWVKPAMRQMEEGGPLVKTNWLTLSVQRVRLLEAQETLRRHMGLFPPEESDGKGDEPADGEDFSEELTVLGTFEAADAAIARKALTEAGMVFETQDDEEENSGTTLFEVRQEDLERAMAVVEAAFGES